MGAEADELRSLGPLPLQQCCHSLLQDRALTPTNITYVT